MFFKNINNIIQPYITTGLVIALFLASPGVTQAQRGGGGGSPTFDSMSCIFDTTVTKGQAATFFVSAGVSVDYTSPVDVTADFNPTGPYVSNAPITLMPNADPAYHYSGSAIIETVSAQPGLHIVTFYGTSDGVTRSCTVYLTVLAPIYVDLEFNNLDGPVTLGPSDNGQGTLSWTAENAVSCSSNMAVGADTSTPTSWTGSRAVPTYPDEETFPVNNLQEGQTYTFRITCYDSGGEYMDDTVSVTVEEGIIATTVQLFCQRPSGPHGEVCGVESGSWGVLTWESTGANTCVMTDNQASTPDWPNGGYVDPLTEYGGQMTGNITTNTIYTLTCEGDNGQIDSDTVLLDTYILPEEPDAPGISLDNSTCGYIKITLTPSVPPQFDKWYIGWGTTPEGTTTDLVAGEFVDVEIVGGVIQPLEFYHGNTVQPPDGIDASHYSYNPAPEINNYYKGAAVNTVTSDPGPNDPEYDFEIWGVSEESIGGPININTCDLGIDSSDIDILSVGSTSNNNPDLDECTGINENDGHEPIPGYNVFNHGDTATYQVNICNDGDYDVTNVTVTHTLQNLTLDENSFVYESNCQTASPYEFISKTQFRIYLDDIPAPVSGGINICSYTFKATVTNPEELTGSTNKFKNTAVLSVLGENNNLSTYEYWFGYGYTVPSRGEEL